MDDLKQEIMFELKDISCVQVNEDNTKLYYSEAIELFEYNYKKNKKKVD